MCTTLIVVWLAQVWPSIVARSCVRRLSIERMEHVFAGPKIGKRPCTSRSTAAREKNQESRTGKRTKTRTSLRPLFIPTCVALVIIICGAVRKPENLVSSVCVVRGDSSPAAGCCTQIFRRRRWRRSGRRERCRGKASGQGDRKMARTRSSGYLYYRNYCNTRACEQLVQQYFQDNNMHIITYTCLFMCAVTSRVILGRTHTAHCIHARTHELRITFLSFRYVTSCTCSVGYISRVSSSRCKQTHNTKMVDRLPSKTNIGYIKCTIRLVQIPGQDAPNRV